jgi:hypothetical protein
MNSFDFFLKKIGPQTIFIGGWGKKFNFLDFFFKNFGPQAIKRQSNISLNDRIRIQTVEFEFKQMDQEAIPHYRPPIPAASGSAGTVRTVVPDPTPTRTLPPVWASTSLRRTVVPGALTIAHRGGRYRPTREPALDYL